MSDTSSTSVKGLRRTYGRGSGEHVRERIPMRPFRPKISRLYDAAHAKYPQSGAYAADDVHPDGPGNGGPERRDDT